MHATLPPTLHVTAMPLPPLQAASKGIVLGESSGGVILPNQAPPTHNPTPYLLLTVALFAVASLVQ